MIKHIESSSDESEEFFFARTCTAQRRIPMMYLVSGVAEQFFNPGRQKTAAPSSEKICFMQATTQLLHSIPVDPLTGAIAVPIYQTSTFVQEAPGVNKGYDYSRTGNPTRATLENLVAQLEGGSTAAAFASGLAAIDAVLKLLRAGDEIVAVDDIYGGAFRLFEQVYKRFGITVHYVDSSQPGLVFNALTPKTKLIWIETPTNPTLKITDIRAIAKIANAHKYAAGQAASADEPWADKCLLCVDNTFASPALQQPLALGADIVVHSGTKYLGGHSDLIAGLVVTADAGLGQRIKFLQNAGGAILGPFDSWLLIRGIETLHLRVRQHCANARAIAAFLEQHPAVDNVYYPGLPAHPGHTVAAGQSKGFGGIVSFSLKNDTQEAATAFVTSTHLFKLAESLGGIKSLVSHPAQMTHKTIPADRRRAAGVQDSLIRLSAGLEDTEDLIDDLRQALEGLALTAPTATKKAIHQTLSI
jgi:cystathionine beta-lyase